jgi:secreted trypsin-like serine protease
VAVAQRFVVSGWNWGLTPGQPVNDLALLHLAHPLNIKPMTLATERQPQGYFGVVYGWSVGADRGCKTEISPDLQQFPVRIDPCPAGSESSRNVCAGTPNDSAGPCDGASGGPIVSLDAKEHPVLHGVYSIDRGRYCGQGAMFFSSVPQYRQWLLDKMAAHS